MHNNKSTLKLIKESLLYVGKLISSAMLVLVVVIGLFLIYYLFSSKLSGNNNNKYPEVSLFTIVSGSMVPNIKVYDVIINKSVKSPANIKLGDVITFTSTSSISEGMTVTHRVVDVKLVNGEYEFVTKGDANPTIDNATVPFSNVQGKVIARIPQLGRIQFFLATKMGWFIIVLLPALGVIIYDIIKLLKVIMAHKNSKIIIQKTTDSPIVVEENNKQYNETLENIKKSDFINRLNELKKFENNK